MDPSLANELTTHAAALRALARQLVGESDADDLVQDTALAALRARPDGRGGLWGWLARVLQNRARNERRDAARRAHREAAQPAPAPAPSAARVAEAHEAVQRLTAALLALPEPYHGVLLMRFFEGSTPTAIAAASGEPLATIKSRLQRGLALLRERLDAGDRNAARPWRAGLCGAFGMDQAARAGAGAAVTAGAAGAMLMGTAAKVGIVTAAAAAAMLAFVWNDAPGARAPGVPEAGVTASAAVAASPLAAAASAEPSGTTESASRVAVVPPAVDEPRPHATVRGRCVDERGAPLAGASVHLRSNSRGDEAMSAWTKDHVQPANAKLDATTDAAGRFSFTFWPPPPMQFFLSFHTSGRAYVTGRAGDLDAGAVRDLGDVVLPPGTLLRGRLVGRDGAPVAERRIEFVATVSRSDDIGPVTQASTASRADGSFTTGHAFAAGVYRIVVRDAQPHPAEVAVDGSLPVVAIDLVIDEQPEAGPSLRGVVVDEAGAPIAGALVGVATWRTQAGLPPDHGARTDAAGAFALKRAASSPSAATLAVHAPGFEQFVSPEPLRWERDNVRLVLRRAGAIALHVVRADDGTPVEYFQARLAPGPGNPTAMGTESMRVRASGHHDGGRAQLDGVPRGTWWLVVEPKGDALALAAFVPVTVGGEAPMPVTVPLQRTATRTVRVRNGAGEPVAGTVVELGWIGERAATADTYAHPLTGKLWAQSGAALRLDGGTTDAAGEVAVRGPAATPLVVFVRGPGHVPFLASAVRLDEAGPLELTVDAGTTVRGTVAPLAALADLRQLAGLPRTGDVDEKRRSTLPGVQLWRREGSPRQFPRSAQPIAADGTFRIDGVPPGRWDVQVAWFEPMDAGTTLFGKEATLATIDALGPPVEMPLDLAALRTGELAVLAMRGEVPAAGARVYVRLDGDTSNQSMRGATTDAAGRARFQVRAGRWELQIHEQGGMLGAAERAVVVAGETTHQRFHIESARLQLRVLDVDGKPAQGVRVDLAIPDASPPFAAQLPRTDAAGRTAVVVPPGTCVLTVLPEALQDQATQERLLAERRLENPFAPHRLDLARIPVASGTVVERELRLPSAYRR